MDMGDDRVGGLDLRKTEVGEFFAQCFDEFGADMVLVVVFIEVLTLLEACVTADGGDVDHAIPLEVERVSIGMRGSTERLPPPPPSCSDASSTILDITVPIDHDC